MTNRNYIRPYSAGMAIKRPRLRRVEIGVDGPPPTPEGLSNGMRPHGGYRGMKQQPPGQFSFNKDDTYVSEIQDEYQLLVSQENQENHGAPYWVSDVQREVTHSGESPLFTNKLLATGKFEQEHGVISMERALFSTKPRRLMSAPRRRHLNGVKEFYRPNSTHQYLSATDLRNLDDNEEVMVKYGRPTRTTLLRARQRSNSAINAYDLRRQANKRMEEVKNNTIFYTAKESFDREQNRLSFRYFNIYQADGETMHSFLTGARYNRAHLLDSKGLSVYGVYMPRENPTECFITSHRRMKDFGDEIPSAPPDSPRSDLDENSIPHHSRPTSTSRHSMTSKTTSSRPGSSHPMSKTTSSRPPSNRKGTPQTLSSRPKSAKEPGSMASPLSQNSRPHPPRSADSNRRELPLPDEVTMAMPDHVNKGKAGVYVTLKGQKIIESVESKLPRVTGVSLPKIRNKSRDFMEEIQVVNQPPPTPVEPSVISAERNRLEFDVEASRSRNVENDKSVENERKEAKDTVGKYERQISNNDHQKNDSNLNALGEVVVTENLIDDRKRMEIRPAKHVNFIGVSKESTIVSEAEVKEKTENDSEKSARKVTNEASENVPVEAVEKKPVENLNEDNVVFFVTENEEDEKNKDADGDEILKDNSDNIGKPKVETEENEADKTEENEEMDDSNSDKNVDGVIKVEILEGEKSKDKIEEVENDTERLSARDYPFTKTENK